MHRTPLVLSAQLLGTLLLGTLLLGCKATPAEVEPTTTSARTATVPVTMGPTRTFSTRFAAVTLPTGWKSVADADIPYHLRKQFSENIDALYVSGAKGIDLPMVLVANDPFSLISPEQFDGLTAESLKKELLDQLGSRGTVKEISIDPSPKGATMLLDLGQANTLIRLIYHNKGAVMLVGYLNEDDPKSLTLLRQAINSAVPAPQLKLL